MTTNVTPGSRRSAALPVGSEVELGFSDLLANGQAVGRTSGMVVFCFGPLPQERARVRITAVKPKYAVAELVELTVRSAQRAQPFCPVFGACGGCQVQHLAYPAQLRWKRDVVSNALTRVGGFVDPPVRETIGTVVPRAYRNKMSLVVVPNEQRVGFYRQRTHDVVPIEACPVVVPQLDAHIARLNDLRADPAWGPSFAGVRHIVERASRATEETVVTFTTEHPSQALAKKGAAIAERLPGAAGVTNSYSLPNANAILGRRHHVLSGAAHINESIGGVRYRVSAGSFFQVNVEIVERIFDALRAGLERPRNIVDLYCGAGTFALFFAKMGSRVFGIEENPAAMAEARENARINDLCGSVQFQCGLVEQAVKLPEIRRVLRDAEVVFLDPPRKGTDEATLTAIVESGIPHVWYLSCDPATLARDLKFLAAKGYRLDVVTPFDMFPQTGHVETLALLFNEKAHRGQVADAVARTSTAP